MRRQQILIGKVLLHALVTKTAPSLIAAPVTMHGPPFEHKYIEASGYRGWVDA